MTGNTITEDQIQSLMNNIILQISGADDRVNNLLQTQESLENNYITLLEKTNEQLDLGWTPYGVTFTILSILFTVGAIAAGFVIHWISKDYKDKRKEVIDNANRVIKEMAENEQSRINNRDEKFNIIIESFKEKMEVADSANKKIRQDRIEEIEAEKIKNIFSGSSTTYIPPNQCFSCGYKYSDEEKEGMMVNRELYGKNIQKGLSFKGKCPNCGKEQNY